MSRMSYTEYEAKVKELGRRSSNIETRMTIAWAQWTLAISNADGLEESTKRQELHNLLDQRIDAQQELLTMQRRL